MGTVLTQKSLSRLIKTLCAEYGGRLFSALTAYIFMGIIS
jgi:hypothetical protein